MCDQDQCCCQNPDRLKGKPAECSDDQVRECHGDKNDEHPCC